MFCRGKQGKIFISLQKFTIAAKRAVKSFSTKLTSSLFTFHPAFCTVHTQPYNQNYQQRACVSIYIWILLYTRKRETFTNIISYALDVVLIGSENTELQGNFFIKKETKKNKLLHPRLGFWLSSNTPDTKQRHLCMMWDRYRLLSEFIRHLSARQTTLITGSVYIC